MPTKEIKVPNFPQVYKIVDSKLDGKQTPTGRYRVRKRIQTAGVWTTHSETFDTFDEAKKFAKSHYKPNVPQDEQKRITFQEAFKKFMLHKEYEMKLSLGTLSGYWNRYEHLKFFGPMEMQTINPRTIDGWIDLLLDPEYLKGQQGSRVNYEHEYTLLSSFLRYYRNYGDENFVVPLLDRHRQRACAKRKGQEHEIRFLNTQEELSFLTQLGKNPVFRDVALFQLHTGVRIGEAAALEFRHIDFIRHEARIVQHLHWERKKPSRIYLVPGTKTGPSRSIPLTATCLAMLKKRKFESTSSKVFEGTSPEGWLYYRTIQAVYDQAFKKLELDHRGTHTLRHTFAVRFLDETKDIYALQRVLGHTDLKITQVYAKYSNESVRRSFQLFKGGLDQEIEGDVQVPVQMKSRL